MGVLRDNTARVRDVPGVRWRRRQGQRGQERVPDRRTQEERWRDVVAEHGWMVMSIGEGEHAPGFTFTVGLTGAGLPEVVVYGLPGDVAGTVLNDVARRLLDGERMPDGVAVPRVLRGYDVQLWDATWLQDPLGAAFRLYGRDRVRVRQLVWPDRDGRWPWEPGFGAPDDEPVLFDPPGGGGPRRAGLPDEDDDAHPVPDDWDLPQDPHLSVLTTSYVLEDGLPALLVVHDDDGDWQVLDGVHDAEVGTGRWVHLHHLVEQDPALGDVLATLRPGESARRDAPGAPWGQG